MEWFAKITKPLIIFSKYSILDGWQISEYASAHKFL